MRDRHGNVEYSVDDNDILTIKVDLNRCIGINEIGNYMIATSHGFRDIFVSDGASLERSGLFFQLHVLAKRGIHKTGVSPEMILRIREMWPKLEQSANEFRQKAEEDPELG